MFSAIVLGSVMLQLIASNAVDWFPVLAVLNTAGALGIGLFMGRVNARLSNIEQRLDRLED